MGSGLIEQVASGEAPRLVPLTVEQYHGMLENGILRDGDPIELVEGLLVRKNRAAAGRPTSARAARGWRSSCGRTPPVNATYILWRGFYAAPEISKEAADFWVTTLGKMVKTEAWRKTGPIVTS